METAIPVVIITFSVLLTFFIVGGMYRAKVEHCARHGCVRCKVRLGGEVRAKIRTDADRALFVQWLNGEREPRQCAT